MRFFSGEAADWEMGFGSCLVGRGVLRLGL